MLQLGVATELSMLPLNAQTWAELIARSASNTVFQTYEWFDAWWRAFGANHRLYFVWVKEHERVVAFAPLMLTHARGVRKLEFIGAGNADYLDFCYPEQRPELLGAMLGLVQQRRSEWDVLRLANVPVHSVTFQQLPSSIRQCEMRLLHEATVTCPTLMLKDRTAQVRGMIDKYSVRRKVNWFDKHGELKIVHLSEPATIEPHLEGFFSQHTRRWHRDGALSQFERPEQREFFKQLVHAWKGNRTLVFTVVFLDDEPLAYHLGFDYGGRMLWYKPAFNAKYAEHSPGIVLIRTLIEEALRTGKDEFDYTIGAEEFKFRFSNVLRANAYVNVYHSRMRYTAALAEYAGRSVARRVINSARNIAAVLRQKSREAK
jgi:CelD/BcsL family acetyltransferase involved in cellulose biosynthesis